MPREAGLVRDTADGRRRAYTLVTAPLDELAGWLERLTQPSGWQHHFAAPETEVYHTRRERRTAAAPDRTQESSALAGSTTWTRTGGLPRRPAIDEAPLRPSASNDLPPARFRPQRLDKSGSCGTVGR